MFPRGCAHPDVPDPAIQLLSDSGRNSEVVCALSAATVSTWLVEALHHSIASPTSRTHRSRRWEPLMNTERMVGSGAAVGKLFWAVESESGVAFPSLCPLVNWLPAWLGEILRQGTNQ
jgi:hypothetical protein